FQTNKWNYMNKIKYVNLITKIYLIGVILASAVHASVEQPQVFTYLPEKNRFELTPADSKSAASQTAAMDQTATAVLPTVFDKKTVQKKDIAALTAVLPVKDLRRIVADYIGDDWEEAGRITKVEDIRSVGISPDFTYIAVAFTGKDSSY